MKKSILKLVYLLAYPLWLPAMLWLRLYFFLGKKFYNKSYVGLTWTWQKIQFKVIED